MKITRSGLSSLRPFGWCFVLFLFGYALYGCEASEPTFDGSSETAAMASLAVMFPEIDFSPEEPEGDHMPPALETYACAMMAMAAQELFGEGLFSETSDTEGITNEDWPFPSLFPIFDGMTVIEMEAYGVENELIGCLQEFREGIESLRESFE